MIVAIIDYGSGNLRSAGKAVERAAKERDLDAVVEVTSDADRVRRADRIILPGVGAFGDCRRGLAALEGMEDALAEAILHRGRPFLGICVGMQLLATVGREHRDEPGLDWLAGEVAPLRPRDPRLKVPHMGWNELNIRTPEHPLLAPLASSRNEAPHVYFVHSFHFVPADGNAVLATTDYDGPVTAVIGRDNIIGTQFHPEKSQAAGLAILGGFLEWSPR